MEFYNISHCRVFYVEFHNISFNGIIFLWNVCTSNLKVFFFHILMELSKSTVSPVYAPYILANCYLQRNGITEFVRGLIGYYRKESKDSLVIFPASNFFFKNVQKFGKVLPLLHTHNEYLIHNHGDGRSGCRFWSEMPLKSCQNKTQILSEIYIDYHLFRYIQLIFLICFFLGGGG